MVAAKAGVPMKTRSSGRLGPVVLIFPALRGSGGSRNYPAAFGLGELAQDHPALQRRDVVDKENAVEVIDLVLQAHREQPRRLYLADLVLVVEVAQADPRGTRDLGVVLRQ